jgi:hypothetical protein
MTQRITITIPDSLHDRLQAVKDRINVSGICQEAIMHAVGIEEIKGQDVPETEKLLARLQKEKEKYEVGWREQGLKDGREDAHKLHYVEFLELDRVLQEIWKNNPGIDEQKQTNYDALTGLTYGYKLNYFWSESHPVLFERLEAFGKETGFNEGIYKKGWKEGVFSVWISLKDKIITVPAEE